jgi:hypothetical protein
MGVLQIVANSDIESYSEVEKLVTGSAVAVRGTVLQLLDKLRV